MGQLQTLAVQERTETNIQNYVSQL